MMIGRALGLSLVAAATLLMRTGDQHSETTAIVDSRIREVRFTAVVQPDAMTRAFGVKGHHAIVWTEGKSAPWALFRSSVSDHDVRAALVKLGARPGENLTRETWNDRDDSSSPEPDKRVEGTPVEVLISWSGAPPRPLASFLVQKKAATPLLDFRFGGNERWQKDFHSGCIVCLYSCPGGAIGNHARTIRQYEREGVIYSADPKKLPPAGSRVTIHLRPRQEAS